MKKTVVLSGGINVDGVTMEGVRVAFAGQPFDLIHLLDHSIKYFDPEFKNQGDDFLGIIDRILTYDRIVFATPLYWYAMSGVMKVFFDRLTDLLSFQKNRGEKLIGKECCAVVSGGNFELPLGFEIPFRDTCAYLKMDFKGIFYYYSGKDPQEKLQNKERLITFHKLI